MSTFPCRLSTEAVITRACGLMVQEFWMKRTSQLSQPYYRLVQKKFCPCLKFPPQFCLEKWPAHAQPFGPDGTCVTLLSSINFAQPCIHVCINLLFETLARALFPAQRGSAWFRIIFSNSRPSSRNWNVSHDLGPFGPSALLCWRMRKWSKSYREKNVKNALRPICSLCNIFASS